MDWTDEEIETHRIRWATELLDQHIPSLTDDNDDEIADLAADWPINPYQGNGPADWAIRTCHCGLRIDGFYEYVDHLKEVFRNGK